MYSTHPDYAQLHGGAHRKPAAVVGAPAVVCHLGFWTGKTYQGSAGEDPTPKVTNDTIDQYLFKLYCNLAYAPSVVRGVRSFTTPNADNPADPKYIILFKNIIDHQNHSLEPGIGGIITASRYQIITFKFKWHGLDVTLRFELHTEYFTISIYIDLSVTLPDPAAIQPETLDRFKRHFDTIFDLLKKDEKNPEPYKDSHGFLYHGIWKTFFCEVLEVANFDPSSLGTIFVDFRGLIVGTPISDADSEPFQKPFFRTVTLDYNQLLSAIKPKEWWNDKLKKFWPFLTSERRVDFTKYEFTASQLLDGRALYVTALGAQPYQYFARAERFPLLYFMYVNASSTWQIGRLIDRLHHLGTVRVAAIMELDRLHDAGGELRDSEENIDKSFTRAFAHEMGPEILSKDSQDESSRNIVSDDYKIMEKLFSSIAGIQNTLSQIDSRFDGGLEYRIDRSRYYVGQFREGKEALRIQRLEGFQPYDVFVARRVGSAYYFIDMLGRRRERIVQDLSLLYQYYLASESNRIESRIATRNQRIKDLQSKGEIIVLLALLPYYAGNITLHVLSFPGHEVTGLGEWLVWLFWISLGGLAGFLSFRDNFRDFKVNPGRIASQIRAQRRPLLVLLALMGAVGALIFGDQAWSAISAALKGIDRP